MLAVISDRSLLRIHQLTFVLVVLLSGCRCYRCLLSILLPLSYAAYVSMECHVSFVAQVGKYVILALFIILNVILGINLLAVWTKNIDNAEALVKKCQDEIVRPTSAARARHVGLSVFTHLLLFTSLWLEYLSVVGC